jgi:aminopeptidase N
MKDVLTYSLQYQKGAWILHMLRNYIGEDNFRNGIRNYYSKYYNSNTTTEEFKLEMEYASGKNLDKFFDQWLYKGGIIKLDVSWSYNKNLKQIEININQVQNDGYLFEMPVEVELINSDNSSTITQIFMDKKSKKYLISSDYKPKEIKLDPHIKLLADWNIKN